MRGVGQGKLGGGGGGGGTSAWARWEEAPMKMGREGGGRGGGPPSITDQREERL